MNLGASAIATLKLGSQQVSRVMLGSVEVWANLDADAAAYIAAIEGDGISVSATQKSALDAFYKTGKSDGWYSSIKRMYLPIWANATPNSRCMVSGTSGTFAGTVAHEAGYVQGDRTGYLIPDASANIGSLGITGSNSLIFEITKTADTETTPKQQGLGGASLERMIVGQASAASKSFACPTATSGRFVSVVSDQRGVFVGVSGDTNNRYLVRAHSGGSSVIGSNTATDTSTLPNIRPYMLARNNNDSGITLATDAEVGAFGFGVKTTSEASAISLASALKTLWETCTGLSLP